MNSRLMLLDTASLLLPCLLRRARQRQAPNGTPVNAVRGLLDFIARLVDEYQPTHLACCWDNDWRPAVARRPAADVQGPPRGRRVPDDPRTSRRCPTRSSVQVPIIVAVLDGVRDRVSAPTATRPTT